MITISLIGQFLHFTVLVIACTKTKHGKIHTAFTFVLDEAYQFIFAGNAYIEITVGGNDHAVIAFFHELLPGNFIGEFDAFTAGRGTTGIKPVDGIVYLLFVVARRCG